jgi:hypothetical protein
LLYISLILTISFSSMVAIIAYYSLDSVDMNTYDILGYAYDHIDIMRHPYIVTSFLAYLLATCFTDTFTP